MDYIVRLIPLPSTVRGFVTLDSDGLPNVYINAGLPEEIQRRTLNHELDHIRRNDFFSQAPIRLIET